MTLRPTGVMTRRTLLHLAGLTGLGAAVPSLLSACSSSGGGSVPGVSLAASDVAFGTGDPALIGPTVEGMTAMAGRLLGQLGEQPGNLAISPYSIQTALAMTVNGARGETRQQMLDTLGIAQVSDLNAGMAALTRHLDGLAGTRKDAQGKEVDIALDSANTLFGQSDTQWEAEFLDALKRSYDAGMHMVDYRADPEAARTRINEWVSSRTHDRIPQLIPKGVLDTLTRLVLVNALYFKAPWAQQFEEQVTKQGAFHLAGGSTTTVDYMTHMVERVPYAENDDWQAVQLPYVGNELAMTVVLPRPQRFEAVWQTLTSQGALTLLGPRSTSSVELTLPRWTFRSASPLKQVLEALGMTVPFDDLNADFSGMTREEQLYITDVLHETWIAVDENGTEAAAATAVVVGTTSIVLGTPMKVDRPFFFVIHDTRHLTPLFVGRVMDPTQE